MYIRLLAGIIYIYIGILLPLSLSIVQCVRKLLGLDFNLMQYQTCTWKEYYNFSITSCIYFLIIYTLF